MRDGKQTAVDGKNQSEAVEALLRSQLEEKERNVVELQTNVSNI
jgi:hypothetical protein